MSYLFELSGFGFQFCPGVQHVFAFTQLRGDTGVSLFVRRKFLIDFLQIEKLSGYVHFD
jgi:hypothetical protein